MKNVYYKLILFCATILLALNLFNANFIVSKADTGDGDKSIYLVYNENNEVIFESNRVEVGDKIITKNLEEYEIYKVDYSSQQAFAELNGYYVKPKINKTNPNAGGAEVKLAPKAISKSVGLYNTHNDESYVPTDNTSSVYGQGGIFDVTKKLAQEFEAIGYNVYIDETLHLPHDKNAYTRSSVTAKRLLEKNPDALFDIHRDGVARSVYVKNIDGIERCKVRIVIGTANPNSEANLQFAMYLLSVAEEYCPWLFLDIYMAKGHYNQALTSKGLLFEMGTYLAEKELVLDTTKELAKVVDKTLFSTVVEDDGSLNITDKPNNNQTNNLVNNVLNDLSPAPTLKHNNTNIIVFIVIATAIAGGAIVYAVIRYKKRLKQQLIQNKNNSKQTKKRNNKKA